MDLETVWGFIIGVFLSNIFEILLGIGAIASGLVGLYFYRNSVAKNVLKGHQEGLLSNAHIVFSGFCFAKPLFIGKDANGDEKEQTLRDIKNLIIKNHIHKKKIMVIHSEAGMGKTRLMQYLAYRLRMRNFRFRIWNGEKWVVDNNVFFGRLRRFDSIKTIISQFQEKNYKYILLDGLDEFQPVTYENTLEVLKELLHELSELQYTHQYSKIIITSRTELFKAEKDLRNFNISTEIAGMFEENDAEILKIKRLNYKQIKKIYKGHCRIYKTNSFIKRQETLILLNKYFNLKYGENSVLCNSFFATHIDEIIESYLIDEGGYLIDTKAKWLDKIKFLFLAQIQSASWNYSLYEYNPIVNAKALSIIIEKSLKKEKELFKKRYGAVEDDYEDKLLKMLDKVALKMLENKSYDAYFITGEEKEIAELRKYFNTQILLILTASYFEFSHKMIFEYFIARNIQEINRSDAYNILNYNPSFINVIGFYAYLLYCKDKALKYNTKKHLTDTIDLFPDDKIIRELDFDFGEREEKKIVLKDDYDSILHILKKYRVIIKCDSAAETDLKIDTIATILPLADSATDPDYNKIDLRVLMDGELDLKNRNLIDLNKISKFGTLGNIKKLNVIGNDIIDFSGIINCDSFEELKVSIVSVPYLKEIQHINIDLLYVVMNDYKDDYLIQLSEYKNIKKIVIEVPDSTFNESYDDIVSLYRAIALHLKIDSYIYFTHGYWLYEAAKEFFEDISKSNELSILKELKEVWEMAFHIHQSLLGFLYPSTKIISLIKMYCLYYRLYILSNADKLYFLKGIDFYTKVLNEYKNENRLFAEEHRHERFYHESVKGINEIFNEEGSNILAKIYHLRGEIYDSIGDNEKALQDKQKAIEIYPNIANQFY